MERCVPRWIEWINVQIDAQNNGWNSGWTDGGMGKWMNTWISQQMAGWVGRRMDK